MASNNDTDRHLDLNIPLVVDDAFRSSGMGDRSRIIQQSLRGINLLNTHQAIQPQRTNSGMVFFTRPRLNLTYSNLSRERKLLLWANSHPMSIAGYTRAVLDPDNNKANNIPVKTSSGTYNYDNNPQFISPLCDPKNPFITVLGNNLLSLSGWPDVRLDVYTSDKGIRNEQWFMIDGVADVYDAFTLDTSFRNDSGEPIMLLMDLWTKYMAYVRSGRIYPYPKMIGFREIDYMSRIYSFNFDDTRTYLTHWAACGAAAPTNLPVGKQADYDYDKILKEGGEQLSFSWQCVGADYNDVITLYEFNKLVATFNPDLDLYDKDRESYDADNLSNIPKANGTDNSTGRYIKLRPGERKYANYRAYPLINIYTKEMEWWMLKSDYQAYVLNDQLSEELTKYSGISAEEISTDIAKPATSAYEDYIS